MGTSFFSVGGTLGLDAASYVMRSADHELVGALVSGEYCYVLNSRQMGKSSLCLRAKAALEGQGVRVAFLDLTKFGGRNVTPEQWYASLVSEIGRAFGCREALLGAYKEGPESPMARFFAALEKHCLERPSVVMVDEIDVTRSLGFDTDEFFAGIRECYNRRNLDASFKNLTFALIGVATPSELIRDPRTTPFNIGKRIELKDFTREEVKVLEAGLGAGGARKLERVMHWTSGHPYLTQAVCAEVAASPAESVDSVVERLFFAAKAKESNVNFADVQNRLLNAPPEGVSAEEHRSAVLDLYARVRSGKRSVKDDDADGLVSVLKLCGLTSVLNGYLLVRNRIYFRVFDRTWIRANMPNAELERQRRAARVAGTRAGLLGLGLTCLVGSLAVFGFAKAREAERLLYQANLSLIGPAWDGGDLGRVKQLLDDTAKFGDTTYRPEWNYWDRRLNPQLMSLEHENSVVSATYSKDGSEIISATLFGHRTRVWDAQSGKEIASFGDGNSADVSPDSRTLVTTSEGGGAAHIWDIRSGKKLVELDSYSYTDEAAVFSPDGNQIASVGSDHTARISDAHSGKELHRLIGHSQKVVSAAFSPNGGRIVTASADGTARIWDVRKGIQLLELVGHTGEVNTASFSPDGSRIVTAGSDSTFRVWNSQNGKEIVCGSEGKSERTWGGFRCAAFSMDGARIVTGGSGVSVWDSATGKELLQLKGHTGRINSACFSPNGKRILTASDDKTVRVWDAFPIPEQLTFEGHKGNINDMHFSPNGDRIITASEDKTARVWDAKSGKQLLQLRDHSESVVDAAFSADGSRIVTVCRDVPGRVWDADSGRELVRLQGEIHNVYCADFSSDGSQILASTFDQTSRVWDSSSGKVLVDSKLTSDKSLRESFPSNRVRLTHAWSSLRDDRTGKELLKLEGNYMSLSYASFSPDGSRVATGSLEKMVRIWDVKNGRELLAIQFPRPVYAVVFSPDGSSLAVASGSVVNLVPLGRSALTAMSAR